MFKFEIGELVLVGQMKHKKRVSSRHDLTKTHGTNAYTLEEYSASMYEYELSKVVDPVGSTTGDT